MPETQTLLFNAGTGLTIVCKLFALGSDTVVVTATAVERTNDLNRYAVAFTDIPAGVYRLNGFVSGVAGFANEVYDLTLSTATFYPRSEGADPNTVVKANLISINGANVKSVSGRMEVNTTHIAGRLVPAVCETAPNTGSHSIGINIGGLVYGSGGGISATGCVPITNTGGGPLYRINDIVYLRESAAIGSIEALRITDVSSYQNTWVYKVASSINSPRAPSTFGDRISHVTGAVLYYTQSEFCDLCTALNIAKDVLEKRLQVIEDQISIYFGTE
jgi:hypothetical protein